MYIGTAKGAVVFMKDGQVLRVPVNGASWRATNLFSSEALNQALQDHANTARGLLQQSGEHLLERPVYVAFTGEGRGKVEPHVGDGFEVVFVACSQADVHPPTCASFLGAGSQQLWARDDSELIGFSLKETCQPAHARLQSCVGKLSWNCCANQAKVGMCVCVCVCMIDKRFSSFLLFLETLRFPTCLTARRSCRPLFVKLIPASLRESSLFKLKGSEVQSALF